ncbi:hypothetical protein [Pediococcus pentosaceus]|uniref:hypothetical protein n=1 Tax=Pediococcus pentosaceus TaxID=1255 RepID=UPI00223BA4CB|nr:hypothetical protein [Pediococcus pentosaceus]MCT1175339.1 hypothetical protein [Pediococcus pentosaceus]
MIINDKKMDQYLEVQLIGHKDNKIKAKTSAGQYIFIYPTTEQTNDPLFWKSLKDIINNKMWLPITKQFHQLIASDWLVPSIQI